MKNQRMKMNPIRTVLKKKVMRRVKKRKREVRRNPSKRSHNQRNKSRKAPIMQVDFENNK